MLNGSAAAGSPSQTKARWTLICLQIIGGLIAIPWLPLGLFVSCFMFDAPDSQQSLINWLAWLLAVGWPWMFIAASVKSWRLFKQGWPWAGVLLTAGIVAPAVFIFGTFAITIVNDSISVEDRWARIKQAKVQNTFPDRLQQRLAESISRGDLAAMEAALRDGASANARGKHGLTMLLWAVAKRQPAAFELLLKHGADLEADLEDSFYNTWGDKPQTVVEQIAVDEEPEFLKVAIAHGLEPNRIREREPKKPLLTIAVEAGAIKNIELLVNEGADVNHTSEFCGPPIRDAFWSDRHDIVLLLLKLKASPWVADCRGRNVADGVRATDIQRVRGDRLSDYKEVIEQLRNRGLLSDREVQDALTPKPPKPLP